MLLGLLIAFAGVYGQNWKLVWADEFDGDTLNTQKWSYMIGDGTEYGYSGLGKQ